MDSLLRSPVRAYLVLVAGAALLPALALEALSGAHGGPTTGLGHLAVMAAVSTIAACASIGLLVAGVRGNDPHAVISGGAFAAMSLLLALHGIATPGVLFDANGVIALAGGIALPVGGALLALSAVPSLGPGADVRGIALGFAALLVAIAAAGTVALAVPSVLPHLPQAGDPLAVALLVVGACFFLLSAWRASRTYALTRRTADLCVVVGVVWLGCALAPQLLFTPGGWAFWLGHVLELSGIAMVGIPLTLDVYRGRPSRPTAGDLPAAALVADEEAFLGTRVRALMARLAVKDDSTEQHTRRVAEWAVTIGEELGLAPGRLRELALAGLLHDIGKLSVPDAILRKPGALTDEEFATIQGHPVWGDELLAELGYPERIRRPVRGHHERLDGSGYPDGLAGDAIDLETRILAVADVYDALVSPRVYRGAWDRERALGLLRAGAGVEFDAACVAALERVLGAVAPPIAA
ncbi:MAG TPA: HD-GYP domain-containing protein [Capillimicrobium sp.]|nr:HD-GYP domain-containing protein [Capillimicrobium sp.]